MYPPQCIESALEKRIRDWSIQADGGIAEPAKRGRTFILPVDCLEDIKEAILPQVALVIEEVDQQTSGLVPCFYVF